MSMFSPPTPPDPNQGMQLGSQLGQQQQTANTAAGVQSQAGSMVSQFNPYGSLTYGQIGTGPGGVPLYGSSEQLSAPQQGLLNLKQGQQGIAGMQGVGMLGGAGYGGQQPSDVIGNMTSGTTGQILGQETNYLQPFFNTNRSQLDTQLRNQGLLPGQPAYDNAMRGMDTSQGLTVSNFLAQAEPQAYNQAVQNYQMPLGMATALSQYASPANVNANLTQTPGLNIQPANYIGATSAEQQALNQQYQAQAQQYSALMSGLFGLGGNALKMMAGMPPGMNFGGGSPAGGTAGAALAGG